MARKRDRIFAGLGALLFFGSASALTVAVIWQANQQSNSNTANNNQAQSCMITSVAGPTEKLPDVYKPTDTVTALQKTDLVVGTGKEAKAGDCLEAKYYGTLTDGTVFDQNFDKPTVLKFTLGQQQVIPGWDQGVPGMKVGGTRRLVIPSSLGYGSSAQGAIPANSTLVFVIKLESIK